MEEKLEFGSVAWIEELWRGFAAAVASAGGDGAAAPFSLCEIYTDVPAHLQPDADGRVAWHCRVVDGRVSCGMGALPDADVVITIDYATALPDAQTVYGGDKEKIAAGDARRREARRAGKLSVAGKGNPAPTYLAGLHDHIAARTR